MTGGPKIPNAVKLPDNVLIEVAEFEPPDELTTESLAELRALASRADDAGSRALEDAFERLGITDRARRSEIQRCLGVRIGICCMTKRPVHLETWLVYHAEVVGVERFFLRIEETPELAEVLSRPPWDSLVEARFAKKTSTDWCNVALRAGEFGELALELAREAGLTHLLHLDDDELLYCPSGRLALDGALARMKPTECEAHALTLEAMAPKVECDNAFVEATVFRHCRRDFTSYGSHPGSAGKSFGKLSCRDLEPVGPHHFTRKRYGRDFEVDKGDFTHTRQLAPPTAIILHYESACLERWRRKFLGYARTVHAGRKQRFSFPFYLESLEACLEYVRAEEAGAAPEAMAEAEAEMLWTWSRWKLEPRDLPEPSQRRAPLHLLPERGLTLLSIGAAASLPAKRPPAHSKGHIGALCAAPAVHAVHLDSAATATTGRVATAMSWRRRTSAGAPKQRICT